MMIPPTVPLTIDDVMEFVDLLHPDVMEDVLSFETKQRHTIPSTIIPHKRDNMDVKLLVRFKNATCDNC